MKKNIFVPIITVSLFVFLLFSASVSYAQKEINLDLEIVNTSQINGLVTLNLNLKLRNNLNENISGLTLCIVSPINTDEQYGEVLAGDISANGFASLQSVFNIPEYINKLFEKKMKYFFKIKYYDSQAKVVDQIIRAVPEIF